MLSKKTANFCALSSPNYIEAIMKKWKIDNDQLMEKPPIGSVSLFKPTPNFCKFDKIKKIRLQLSIDNERKK